MWVVVWMWAVTWIWRVVWMWEAALTGAVAIGGGVNGGMGVGAVAQVDVRVGAPFGIWANIAKARATVGRVSGRFIISFVTSRSCGTVVMGWGAVQFITAAIVSGSVARRNGARRR